MTQALSKQVALPRVLLEPALPLLRVFPRPQAHRRRDVLHAGCHYGAPGLGCHSEAVEHRSGSGLYRQRGAEQCSLVLASNANMAFGDSRWGEYGG